jgi:hypothetical protein
MTNARFALPRSVFPWHAVATTVLLLSAATDSSALAAIVYFPVTPAQTITGNATVTFGSINLSNGTFSLNNNPPSFGLGSTSGGSNTLFTQDNNDVEWAVDTPNPQPGLGQVTKYAATASISGSSIPFWSSADPNLFTSSHAENWYATGTSYAGLRIDAGGGNYNYGWVSVGYDVASSTTTVTGFAFENQVNTAIPAAAVPEPASLALAGAGAAFVAAVYRRRSRFAARPC